MRNTGFFNVIVLATSLVILSGCESATDNSDPQNSSTGNENISNQQPVAVISPDAEQYITEGEALQFDGADSFDPDGNSPLSYQWTFTGAATSISSYNNATPGIVTFEQEGTVIITLVVTDSVGAVSEATSVRVFVFGASRNRAPNGFITHDGGIGSTGSTGDISITTGTNVVFDGDAVDPDNDLVNYDWNFPANVNAPVSPGGQAFSIGFPVAGIYVISLTVSDNANNIDPTPAQVTVTVTDVAIPVNQPPNGLITHDNGTGATGSMGNISISTGATVMFAGNALDPENDPVSYGWNFPVGVSAPASPAAGPFSVGFPSAGIYLITLTVSDNQGNSDPTPAQVTVTVTDPGTPVNLPPNGFITHDNGSGATGSTGNISISTGTNVVFIGSATDPESDPVSYSWNFPVGVIAPASPAAGPFSVGFPTAGIYLITLTVSDNQGNSDPTPAQVTVTVTDPGTPINLPPDGSISHDNGTGAVGSVGNINIGVGATVVFQGNATDPENDTVTYSWTFDGGTASSTIISGPVNVEYSTPGSFPVSLTVTDSNGNIDPTPAELTVNVSLPEFQYLPVLSDQDGNSNDSTATYNLTANNNVAVQVVTPEGSWITPMMRYNGLQLPPVIKARRGMQMTFNVANNLGEETTIHWHGFQIPAAQDGGPDMPIAAGGERTYSFSLVQPGGPLWFHPHAHGTTATQVYNGLAGAFIVSDSITDNLEATNQIPSGDQDIALLLQDRTFTADNGTGIRELVYQPDGGMMGGMLGMLGDRILVNGVEMPGLDVATRQYRFRVFNGSNARTYDIALSDGSLFRVVGTDGGLLNNPVLTDHVMLSAGERAEIVVDFGNYQVGDNVMLVSRAFAGGGMMGGGALPNGDPFNIMLFQVTTPVLDNVSLYSSLPTSADINSRLTAGQATATRSFVMSIEMMPMRFVINGQTFDMNRVDELIASGATEIWEVSNTSAMAHPFHAHAIQWQVLDRNGIAATGVDLGWKDTVLVQPNETVRIIGRFDPVVNVGRYMYHCHILEHEEAGMMGIFEVQAPLP